MPQPPNESDRREPPGRNGRDGSELLPGWSSLVILLTVFAALAVITLLTLLHDDGIDSVHAEGGRVAFGPVDFPDLDFAEPLLASVTAAADADQPAVFRVPPPPFSDEGIFPCSQCHEDLEVNTERRELEYFHDEIQLSHGPEERWCFDCHNADDRDHLRLASGELVGFEDSYRLCGQCHGTIYRDWREGIHGRRRGYWNGAKSYLLCAHCHNPHAPRYAPMTPLPPPVRPQFLRVRAAPEASGEGAE